MWQRFTERARRVVFFAQEEAGRLGTNHVCTEHLLLGLVREQDAVAPRLLDKMGFSLGRIRSEVERQAARGDNKLGQDTELTSQGKRVIDLAYDEAKQLNNNYIGTEHLLLGLIREGEGLAGRVLAKLGVDLEQTRRAVQQLQDSRLHAFREGLEALPSEQQQALAGEGMPFGDLPPAMQQGLRSALLNPNALAAASVRVVVTQTDDDAGTTAHHYELVVQTTLRAAFDHKSR